MGISTETILRGTVMMLPWAISLFAVWLSTNSSDPDSPMLTKTKSKFLIALGILLFLTGMILVNMGVLEGVIQEFRVMDDSYKILGILLVFYGYFGRNYKLIKIIR